MSGTAGPEVPLLVGARAVWGGRWSPEVPGALDGWNCDHFALREVLAQAAELVVLDALSFPWDVLRDNDRDLPLVLGLPAHLSVTEIELLLTPALTLLSPVDKVIEGREEVRAQLTRSWGLPPDAWIDVASPGGLPEVCAALEARSRDCLRRVDTDIGTFLTQRDDLITRQLDEFGAHQRGTLNALMALTSPGDVLLDVGAHIGTFAVPLARRVGDGGHVYCIEGVPETAALLRANIGLNALEDRVTVMEHVVGGEATGRVAARRRFGNTGGSAFEEAGWSEVGSQRSRTLDEVMEAHPQLAAVDIIKMDVEGAEHDALTGAEDLISRARPAILLEVSDEQLARRGATLDVLDDWFRRHDYRLSRVAGERNTRRPGWQVTPLETLREVEGELVDVLATPAESSRFTSDLGGEQ